MQTVDMTCKTTLVYYLLYITTVCPTPHSSPQVNKNSSILDLINTNRHYGQSPGFFIFEMDGLEPKYLNQYLFPSVDHPPWLEDRLQEAESRGLEYVLTCLFLKSTSGVHCLLLDKAAGQGPIQLYRRCGVVNIEYRLEEFEEGWSMETVSII
jgi:hypothetical protein